MKKHGTLRGLRHDEKSHYALIMDLAKHGKIEELEAYETQINSMLDSCRHCTCDNFVIASAVNQALDKAMKYGIDLQYGIETSYLPVNAFEQNVILRNILNNAFEACKNCPEGKGFINLSITRNIYGDVMIKCRNSSLYGNKNYYVTSKKDKRYHGIGLKNVQRIVTKRNGTLHCTNEDNAFIITVILKN